LCCLDVGALSFLCAAAEQDDNLIAVLAEIHAIPRAEINFQLQNAGSYRFTFDVLPVSKRVKAR
jgi:hypothetical protein